MANMTPERFMEIKNRAKRLIDMDVNGQLDNIKTKAVKEGKLSYTSDGAVDTNIMSTQNVKQTQMMNEMKSFSAPESFSSSAIQNSKLPKEIIESMVNNPIDTTMLEVPGVSTSILDQMDYMTGGKVLQQEQVQPKPQAKQKKEVVNEQIIPSSTPIDYSMIKMIVEESVKKYASSLKKSILQENKSLNESNELQAMKIGNKFSFITKNGDLYEAQLKFIKNINK